ncbi:MAG TPA: diaminopimelate epimerase [Burkholderiaceae bacterium]|nr:diaminopimelate epimerase [Burkholderiaceae bacterium]
MRLRFTKMQGAGNDFIVVDATRTPVDLKPEVWRRLADRRFGIGADQVLIVGAPRDSANDFSYRIINADGGEVEHCGNGARAFLRYVTDKQLTTKRSVRVEIRPGVITLNMREDGDVSVDMGVPNFEPAHVPFDAQGLAARRVGELDVYTLPLNDRAVDVAVASMGNPHAVQRVENVDAARVAEDGPLIEHHARFPSRVNVGFMQIVDRHHIRLRVWERGSGETLACGTGACAAVVCAIAQGLLDSPVRVDARGGRLEIAWGGGATPVVLTGPAVSVFEGEIEV